MDFTTEELKEIYHALRDREIRYRKLAEDEHWTSRSRAKVFNEVAHRLEDLTAKVTKHPAFDVNGIRD